jgi:hypothetical protein
MLLVCYPSKKVLKASVGKPLRYRETSVFGEEYRRDGVLTVAYRPSIWKHVDPETGVWSGREFFARVTVKEGLISKVE